MLNAMEIVVCVGLLAVFAWALARYFRREGAPNARQRWSVRIVTATGLATLYALCFRNADWPAGSAAAFALAAVAAALFSGAMLGSRHAPPALLFAESAPGQLFQRGAYRWVRHPFYSSYIFLWLACLFATREPLLLPLVAACFAVYVAGARDEERIVLGSDLAVTYKEYQMGTGMFVPRLWPRRNTAVTGILLAAITLVATALAVSTIPWDGSR